MNLTLEVVRNPCVFILHIQEPAETLRRLAILFQERKITFDNLQLHTYRNGEASLIIHCHIIKDKIPGIVELLKHMHGIMELKKMEG